jgi:hypothetical protein
MEERIKYGRESQGTQTREGLRWRGPAAYTKDRHVLLSERAPQKNKTVKCQRVINICSWADITDWLTVRRNVTLTWRIRSRKGAAVQRGLEPGSRGIAIVRSWYQETSSEDIAGWERLNDSVTVICSYDPLVVNKSSYQSKTPSRVTHICDSIHHNRFIFIMQTLYFAFEVLTAVRRHVGRKEFTDVSEESTASIIRVKE